MFIQLRDRPRPERGQILVIVALGLVAIVVMVGLVLDGGAAYAQRRSQQNASDMAAMAGANAYLLTNDVNAARSAALQVAAENGWQHGTGDVTVTVTVNPLPSAGGTVKVDVTASHHNDFGAVIGLNTWDVGTTATALTGFPDTADGAAPFIFSRDAFEADGKPKPQYADENAPYAFGDTNNDAPETPGDFAWTNYGTGNVSTDDVKDIMDGTDVITKTLMFGEYIGQHNQGNHTALYDSNQSCDHKPTVNKCYAGQNVVVPIVDHDGKFMGWATFHVTSAQGGSTKKIFGYFLGGFQNQQLSIGGGGGSSCQCYVGSYVLKLID
jgi:Flp pilus assembly protein TadG